MKRAVEQKTSAWSAALALLGAGVLGGCDGSSSGGAVPPTQTGGKASLIGLEYGRLVDIYAFRRIDRTNPERRDTLNREPALIRRDVMVGPDIQSEDLFDATGAENTGANYRFLPFDVAVGHDELLILWDDRDEDEGARFTAALNTAQTGLVTVPGSFRGQNTVVRPIPVVPRNAALKLTFDRNLGLSQQFFAANPGAVQVLEFTGDPAVVGASQAFRPVQVRFLPQGSSLVIDTTLIGAEAGGGLTSTGLPTSLDNETANIRVAIPSGGAVSSLLEVEPDSVTALNAIGSAGRPAVIRDFRSGNPDDGLVGALRDVDPPMVMGSFGMGIVAVDTAERVLTIEKRGANVAIRARIPFVDGGLLPSSGLPGGPAQVPTEVPLRSGDVVLQDVVSPITGETVRIRAEVVQNLDVGSVVGDPNMPVLGMNASGSDNGSNPVVRLRVTQLSAVDSQGNRVSFESAAGAGRDCTVNVSYYHNVPYVASFGAGLVRDADRLDQFVVVESGSTSGAPDPFATVSLRFTEPMDLETIDRYDNFLLTDNSVSPLESPDIVGLLSDPKVAGLSVQPARLVDAERNATLLQLVPPLGFFHEAGVPEIYWLHLIVDPDSEIPAPADLSGNVVDLFDRNLLNPATSLSVSVAIDAAAEENLVGGRVFRFESADEDGTVPGSVDFFGQFQLIDGRLSGAETSRFQQTADAANLAGIQRFNQGSCWDPQAQPVPTTTPPDPTIWPPGQLYQCPTHVVTIFQPPAPFVVGTPVVFGGVLEPLNPRGSRLQMTYREDDFSLSYTDPSSMMIDVEQLHWAPWNGDQVDFDTFDRMTMSLAHADWRPDLLYNLVFVQGAAAATCDFDCASAFSGLTDVFESNYLEGTQRVDVVVDKVYQLSPNDSFRSASTGTLFTPYPTFETTYTWRDSRLVSWDMANDSAIGLSGAKLPDGVFPSRDRTAHISSPWAFEFPQDPANPAGPGIPAGFTGTTWDVDAGDFLGHRRRDHDPIAMPLLVEFMTFPDSPVNGLASGANSQHIAMVGPCWAPFPGGPGGFYNLNASGGVPGCNGVLWPAFRVHSSGGIDILDNEIFVDPANEFRATGGFIFNPGIGDPVKGVRRAPFGDDHLHWAQADFVRRVSSVTYGFFDTLRPNAYQIAPWSGSTSQEGFPNLVPLANGVRDLITVQDPPDAQQPAGTSVRIEFRFVDDFDRADVFYDPNDPAAIPTTTSPLGTFGNLLNPNYACEAYRYATPNWDPSFSQETATNPRVRASGLTPYVTEEGLDRVRDPAGLLPRYANMRIVFENNIVSAPAVSPSLRSLAVVFRYEGL